MAVTLSTANSALFEPKRKNRWIVQFGTIPGFDDNISQNHLQYACYKGAKPNVSFSKTEMKRINETWKFAGRPTWDDIEFAFYDFIRASTDSGSSAFTLLNGWKDQIYDAKTGMAGYAVKYKTNATVGMLDPTGAVIQTWHIFYCWPSALKFGDLDYTSDGDAVDISMTLTYDYAINGTESVSDPGSGPTGPYPKGI